MAGSFVVVGAGGLGGEVLDLVEAIKGIGTEIDLVGFLDDGVGDFSLLSARGASVFGPLSLFPSLAEHYVVAVGDPKTRASICHRLDLMSGSALTLVHPHATIGGNIKLGQGSLIFAGARVSANVRLESHVQVHANATVGHDCTIGTSVTLLPGATVGGGVNIDALSLVGSGATILPGLNIGAGSVVGAGAVVTKHVAAGSVVTGIPATVHIRGRKF